MQISALFSLQVGSKLSDIIAQTILILTKIMLHKKIWLLLYLVKSNQSRRHFLILEKIQWKGKVNVLTSASIPAWGLVEGSQFDWNFNIYSTYVLCFFCYVFMK